MENKRPNNILTICDFEDNTFKVHLQIQNMQINSKYTLDTIRLKLYQALRHQSKKYLFIISFAHNKHNNFLKDEVDDVNILVKQKLLNNLYADLYNYAFMEYNIKDYFYQAEKYLGRDINVKLDIIMYDQIFETQKDKIQEIRQQEYLKKVEEYRQNVQQQYEQEQAKETSEKTSATSDTKTSDTSSKATNQAVKRKNKRKG